MQPNGLERTIDSQKQVAQVIYAEVYFCVFSSSRRVFFPNDRTDRPRPRYRHLSSNREQYLLSLSYAAVGVVTASIVFFFFYCC